MTRCIRFPYVRNERRRVSERGNGEVPSQSAASGMSRASQLCDFGHSGLQTLYIRRSAVFTPTPITSHNVQSYFLDITYLHNPPRDAVRPTKSGHHGRANIVTDSIRPPLPCSMLAASRMASGSSWNVAEFSGDGSTPEIHEL